MSDHEPVENGVAPAPAQTTPLAAPQPPRPARGGCIGRFFAALLVVIITTIIALAAVAASLVYLGFTPEMPQQLSGAQVQVGTLQAQNSAMQTQIAGQGQRGSDDHEVLSEIQQQIADIQQLRSQLRDEREASVSQNATLVAEARNSRDAVALFATAEAGRAALLQQLEQRSARVERFLQRLSDIADDTALDLTAVPVPTQVSQPTASLEPSPASPTATPAPSITSTSVAATATEIPSRTPRAAPSPTATLGR
jgi:hypothetical protein